MTVGKFRGVLKLRDVLKLTGKQLRWIFFKLQVFLTTEDLRGCFMEFYGIFRNFLKIKSGKRSLIYIPHEFFTIRIVSMEEGGGRVRVTFYFI